MPDFDLDPLQLPRSSRTMSRSRSLSGSPAGSGVDSRDESPETIYQTAPSSPLVNELSYGTRTLEVAIEKLSHPINRSQAPKPAPTPEGLTLHSLAGNRPSSESLIFVDADPGSRQILDHATVHAGGDTSSLSSILSPHLGGISIGDEIAQEKERRSAYRDRKMREMDALKNLRYIPYAIYDIQGRNGCIENTRVSVLDEVMKWSREPTGDTSPAIFLLLGMAGAGKTAIAWSVCDKLHDEGRLGGSFFCSRTREEEYGDVTRVIPNLAHHLAENLPAFKSALVRQLEEDPLAPEKGITHQVTSLLQIPFSRISSDGKPPLVLVIDALDECSDQEATRAMINALIETSSRPPIKFFLTSRPERSVRLSRLSKEGVNRTFRLHDIDCEEVDGDIRQYLRITFADSQVFLTDSYLNKLVKMSHGLFVFAATAAKYILSGNSDDRLRRLADSDGPSSLAKKPLHSIYSFILLGASGSDHLEEHEQNFLARILSSILALRSPLSIHDFSILLGEEPGRIRDTLDRLHAVIDVPNDDDKRGLTTLHASFNDYLTASDTNPELPIHVDITDGHTTLSRGSLDIMSSSLRFNMCNLPSSFLFDSEVDDLANRVDENILTVQGLEYSCRNWAAHLARASTSSRATDSFCRKLLELSETKVLFWIEVMNLLSAKEECLDGVSATIGWLNSLHQGEAVHELKVTWTTVLNVAKSFLRSPASLSTPHFYLSILAVNLGMISSTFSGWKGCFSKLSHIRCTGIGSHSRALTTIHTNHYVKSVAFSPDGTLIVSGLSDNSVRIWDASTGLEKQRIDGHTDWVRSVAFSRDGTRIVSGSDDGLVRVWDTSTGMEVYKLRGHTGAVNSTAFSFDGTRIVSGSKDKSVRIWGALTGEEVRKLDGHGNHVFSVAFSPDGTRVVSGSEDGSVRIWDVLIGKEALKLSGNMRVVYSVAFSPDGTLVVLGSSDFSVRIWDGSTGTTLRKLEGHTGSVHSVAFSPDGMRIVSGSTDQSVRVWDAETGEEVYKLIGHTNSVSSVAFSPDSARIVSGSSDRVLRIWDASTGDKVQWLAGHTEQVYSVAFSPDGSRIVSGSYDKSVRIWDASTGDELRQLDGHHSGVTSVVVSPDGTRIASGSVDGSVRVWDAMTGDELCKIEGHGGPVQSVAFSSDGTHIASGLYGRSVRVWNTSTGEEKCELIGHTALVSSVAFSPDGPHIVSGSYDKSVRIWDTVTGEEVRKLGHTPFVLSIAFSADGVRVVLGSLDGSVRIWDTSTGEESREFVGHTGAVQSVTFSPDGTRIISCSDDRSVRIWDILTGEELRKLVGHMGDVLSVAFSPDGTRIVSGSSDQSIRIWEASTELQHEGLEWTAGDSGWIISRPGGDRLLWLSDSLRAGLHTKHTIRVISQEGYTTLDFSDAYLGTDWARCYHHHTQ